MCFNAWNCDAEDAIETKREDSMFESSETPSKASSPSIHTARSNHHKGWQMSPIRQGRRFIYDMPVTP